MRYGIVTSGDGVAIISLELGDHTYKGHTYHGPFTCNDDGFMEGKKDRGGKGGVIDKTRRKRGVSYVVR